MPLPRLLLPACCWCSSRSSCCHADARALASHALLAPCHNTQAFNKVDVTRHEFALTWMADFDAYAAALDADASYASSLSRSLSLLLDEFYAGLASVGVSALTGEGTAELFEVRRMRRRMRMRMRRACSSSRRRRPRARCAGCLRPGCG